VIRIRGQLRKASWMGESRGEAGRMRGALAFEAQRQRATSPPNRDAALERWLEETGEPETVV
jgi:hypothetical protein